MTEANRESLDEGMTGMGDPAGRVKRAVETVEYGVANAEVFGVAAVTLDTEHARALLDERRELAEKLAAATRTVAAVAVQRNAYAAADQDQRALIASQAETIRKWHAAVQEPDAEAERVERDLRAARDMFRRPDDQPDERHFSLGYGGEKPDHHGPSATCAMPACVKSRAQHEAADAIQDLTYQILADPDTKQDPDD